MIVYGLDPGTTKSALVGIYPETLEIAHKELDSNKVILHSLSNISGLHHGHPHHHGEAVLAVEFLQSYGMPVGRSVFQTCVWIGRFMERWEHELVFYARPTIAAHITGIGRAKDSDVRRALITRLGDWRKGGPLEGIKKDLWSALAVAVAHVDGIKKLEWIE